MNLLVTQPDGIKRAILGPGRIPLRDVGKPFTSEGAKAAGHATQAIQAMRPQGLRIPAGFEQITVPAGLNITAGQSAWYGLLRLASDTDGSIGDEFTVDQAMVELGPTDPSGVGYSGVAAPLAWGSTMGLRAAIVAAVGPSLDHVQVGSWTSALADVVGVESSLTAYRANSARYLIRQSFPGGKINDTIPAKVPYTHTLGIGVGRVQRNQSLVVALVVRRADVHNQASEKTLCGWASIQLNIQPNTPDPSFAGA